MEDSEGGMNDVTVRLPVGWNAAKTAGFIERAVTDAFRAVGYHGSAFVIYRKGDASNEGFVSFINEKGTTDPYVGKLPHGLVEP